MSATAPHIPWRDEAEGLTVLPLRTPTLPPATTTNTVFIGRRDVWIVDPATPYPDQIAILLRAVELLAAGGRRAMGILLTHHHHDHVGATEALRQATGLGVWAHPETARLLAGRVEVDHPIVGGDVMLGSEADDDQWEVLFTPGHAPGHICVWEPRRRLLVAGDMVAAVGTIVIAPPDGHMATYLAQLERLAALGPSRIVPSHGPVIEDPVERLRFYVQHRLAREARVLAALSDAPEDLMAITRRSYPDVPPAVHGLASGSALAHLEKLRDEGLAASTAGGWSRA